MKYKCEIKIKWVKCDKYRKQAYAKHFILIYASECLLVEYLLKKMEFMKRRILHKIMGTVETETGWKFLSN